MLSLPFWIRDNSISTLPHAFNEIISVAEQSPLFTLPNKSSKTLGFPSASEHWRNGL